MGTEHVETAGSGSVSVVPDRVDLNLRFVCTASDVATALEDCAQVVTTALAALDTAAGPDHVRRTGAIRVGDHWDEQRQRPSGYEATQTLVVRLTDTAQVGAVIAALAKDAGSAFRMDGLGWASSEVVAAEREARGLAFASARAKAEQLATLGGRALGPLVRVHEGGGAVAHPVAVKAMAFDATSMPAEAGESEVRIDLTGRWLLA